MKTLILILICAASCAVAQLSTQSLVAIKTAAEAGYPAAQDQLAERFIMRMETDQALLWYRKAAAQGYAHAQGQLGNMLLLQYRRSAGLNPAAHAAIADEAVKWMTLAANQGDKQGQATLADVCLEGKLVKQNLIEAFKWGDLAAHASMIGTARVTGIAIRDTATLKMSPEQIAEAQRRVAAFTPHLPSRDELPAPAQERQFILSGISGSANRRLAVINGTTFSPDETAVVKVAGRPVKVRCREIREKSVLVEIEGLAQPHELALGVAAP